MIFYKTVSSGNDFIHVDMDECEALADAGASLQNNREIKGELTRELCHRQIGPGADGVVFYRVNPCETETPGQRVTFEIFNRDGSEAELSGNGMAGLTALLFHLGKYPQMTETEVVLDTAAGIKRNRYLDHGGSCYRLKIEIGVPDFNNSVFFPFLEEGRMDYEYRGRTFYPVSVGNPHAVAVLTERAADKELLEFGALLAEADMFPQGVNVELVAPPVDQKSRRVDYESGENVRIFFYERGVGPTLASSTGSAAVYAVLKRLKRVDRLLTIPGPVGPGELIKISGNRTIYIENSVKIVYKGSIFF